VKRGGTCGVHLKVQLAVSMCMPCFMIFICRSKVIEQASLRHRRAMVLAFPSAVLEVPPLFFANAFSGFVFQCLCVCVRVSVVPCLPAQGRGDSQNKRITHNRNYIFTKIITSEALLLPFRKLLWR
jgi:hypothetical protein